MSATFDLAIIGAGPAGLSAALQARELGLSVALLDEQKSPGGQIYRACEASPLADPGILGPDYERGRTLIDAFRSSGTTYIPKASVWQATADGEVAYLQEGRSRFLNARRLILATGAQERPVPIPGWTLPGVMSAGAAQILMKSAGLVPQGPLVLAGAGPLLWLLAWQYVRAGQAIAAILETPPPGSTWAAMKHLPGALRSSGTLSKGIGMIASLMRSSVPIATGVSDLRALGNERLEGIAYRHKGRDREIAAGTLLLHLGVVPNCQLSMALGCGHSWDEAQLCWRPACDAWGTTSLERVAIAGDGATILGALAAEASGALAALETARMLGTIDDKKRDALAKPWQSALAREAAIRPFLDRLYRPAITQRCPPDETIVCRCEEVTAGEIRSIARMGCPGPNQAKSFTRCGMGPCQGRLCSLTVTELFAEVRGRNPQEVGHYRIRYPIKSITLGELADAEEPPENTES
jgi:NADPH-dependent 2,4-dienoyl-CoA reductase/sulfur reductase-like enzyme